MTKIFIVTNPGFYNKGDAALVKGAIKTLKSSKDTSISLICYPHAGVDPSLSNVKYIMVKELSQIRIIAVCKFMLERFEHIFLSLLYRFFGLKISSRRIIRGDIFVEYYSSDVIVAGLNDSFTTIYGPGPFFEVFYAIFLSKILNKHSVIYAGSIGPFKNKFYEKIGRYILNKVDLITLREELSFEYLKRIGVSNSSIKVTADLAFCIDSVPLNRAKSILSIEGASEDRRPLIGVSLSKVISKWAFPELESSMEEKYQNYLSLMAKIMDYTIETFSATIVFIPQVIGFGIEKDDRKTAEDIYNTMINKNHVILITTEYSPEELRSITGLFNLFISSRTHAAISAAMMHVPFVAIEYESHKTRGIVGRMLNCEDLIYDIRTLDFNTLTSKINYVWENREKIKAELKLNTEGMYDRALVNGKLIQELLINGNKVTKKPNSSKLSDTDFEITSKLDDNADTN